eukprot:2323032-Pleurochrysis_carterae.AAC.1
MEKATAKAKESARVRTLQCRTQRAKGRQMRLGRRDEEAAVQGTTHPRRPRNPQPVRQPRVPPPPSARVAPLRLPGRSKRLARPRAGLR